jgi:hypothetical protein
LRSKHLHWNIWLSKIQDLILPNFTLHNFLLLFSTLNCRHWLLRVVIDWLIDRNYNSQCLLLFIVFGFCKCWLKLVFNLKLFKLKIDKIFLSNLEDYFLFVDFQLLVSNLTDRLNSWNKELNIEGAWSFSSGIQRRRRALHKLTIIYRISKNARIFWPLNSFT